MVFGAALFLIAGDGCKRSEAVAQVTPPVALTEARSKGVEERFTIPVGEHAVSMQLAARADEMSQGLMYRKTMGADEGMLFVYRVPQRMSFWMKNTELPLDIGFFDGYGVLKEVRPMYPHDETPVRSRGSDIKFALEMNQGWFARQGVKPGAILDLVALAGALRARGFDPSEFGANLGEQEKPR